MSAMPGLGVFWPLWLLLSIVGAPFVAYRNWRNR